MNTFPIDKAKQDLDSLVAQILDDAEPAVLSTPSGDSVVIMPLSDFSAWQETAYLLQNPANAAHLRKSLAEARVGNISEKELLE